MNSKKYTTIIDNTILVFVFIFLASLTNSIFLNQLGYYGAILSIVLRFYYTKENNFTRSNLEYAFIFFIAAEILSTIFAQNQSQSFHNLLKRVLIIPTFYTFSAAVSDIKTLKMFFYVYIVFALLSCLIYLYISINFLIY